MLRTRTKHLAVDVANFSGNEAVSDSFDIQSDRFDLFMSLAAEANLAFVDLPTHSIPSMVIN